MIKMKSKTIIQGISKAVSEIALGTAFYRTESKETWFGILDNHIKYGGTIIDSGSKWLSHGKS